MQRVLIIALVSIVLMSGCNMESGTRRGSPSLAVPSIMPVPTAQPAIRHAVSS